MSFDTAISGLNAATADLDTIGNNVANASTTGYKSSRAQFADVYASTAYSKAATQVGNGVRLSGVQQQFTQGTLSYTDNSLDLAINGSGFYRLNDGGTTVYSRAGAFSTDSQGRLVNGSGQRLTGYLANDNGTISGQLGDLRVNTSNIEPSATTSVEAGLNLNSNDTAPGGIFSATDPSTYNDSTSLTVYDSLGNSHELATYYVKTGANSWDVHALIDGVAVGPAPPAGPSPAASLSFLSNGSINPAATQLDITGWTPLDPSGAANGAAAQNLSVSLADTTQFGSAFSVNSLTQDGYTTGRLSSVDIDSSGVIMGVYTNGQSKAMGQVALANFANPSGLKPVGDTAWAETFDSGNPLLGAPGTASLGAIQSGALEESNVDLTQELVDLILAQRNFQANAQTIQTEDTVTQTIINLR